MEYLGKYVVDRSSGIRGYATQYIVKFNGSIQYAVQPYSEDGATYKDAFWIDEAFLSVEEIEALRVTQPVEFQFNNGNKIKDIISEKEGIVTSLVTHVNGCTYYLVENADGEFYIPTNRAKFINKGVAAPENNSKAPGGFTTKAPHF